MALGNHQVQWKSWENQMGLTAHNRCSCLLIFAYAWCTHFAGYSWLIHWSKVRLYPHTGDGPLYTNVLFRCPDFSGWPQKELTITSTNNYRYKIFSYGYLHTVYIARYIILAGLLVPKTTKCHIQVKTAEGVPAWLAQWGYELCGVDHQLLGFHGIWWNLRGFHHQQ